MLNIAFKIEAKYIFTSRSRDRKIKILKSVIWRYSGWFYMKIHQNRAEFFQETLIKIMSLVSLLL